MLFVITERWPGAKKYRNAFEAVKHNVIDLIADGKHQGPRQIIVQLKDGLQSTLHTMQGDEDQQDECSRILTDMAGESIVMEQGMLLPMENQQASSPFGTWNSRLGYDMFSPQTASALPYLMNFEDQTQVIEGMRAADTQFQTNSLFSEGFDARDLVAYPQWP